jgi:hypothetical protein
MYNGRTKMDMNDSRWKTRLHLVKGNIWGRLETHALYQMYRVSRGKVDEVDDATETIFTKKFALYRDQIEAISCMNALVGTMSAVHWLTEPDPIFPEDNPLFDLSTILWGPGGVA